MEDAFTIGIQLLLEDGVSAGLASIQAELVSVDRAIAGTTGRLAVLGAMPARATSPGTPVLPVVAAAMPSGDAAAAAPAAPAPLPLPTMQDDTHQAPIVAAASGASLPVMSPAGLVALPAAPVHSAPSLQQAFREAEPRRVTGELHDPGIFAPHLPAPALPAPSPMPLPLRLVGRDPERPAEIAAVVSSLARTSLPPDIRETNSVAAPIAAPVAAVVPAALGLAAPVQVAASPALRTPRITAAQIAPPAVSRTAAVPAAPVVVPAARPATPGSDRPAFAPPAVVPAVVPMSAVIAPAVDAISPIISVRPATPPAEQSRPAVAERQQDGHREIVSGDIYLDGARLGRWVRDHLAREISRPQAGTAAFDPTLSPSWPGALQGS